MGVQQENCIPSLRFFVVCKRCVYQTTLYNSIVIISGFPSLKSCLMRTYSIMHSNEFIGNIIIKVLYIFIKSALFRAAMPAGLIHAKYTKMSLKVTSSLIYTILLHFKEFFCNHFESRRDFRYAAFL